MCVCVLKESFLQNEKISRGSRYKDVGMGYATSPDYEKMMETKGSWFHHFFNYLASLLPFSF